MCIRAATIPRCSGFTTDQIGGIMGRAADARGDVSDGRCRFHSWPVADTLACSRYVGPQRQPDVGPTAWECLQVTRCGHAPADTLDGCCDRRNSGLRISLRNYKVSNGKQNVTAGKRSPIFNNCQPALFCTIAGYFASLATSGASDGSAIAARGGLA